jgi:5-methylthioadenosine/S-adenosylhomocysteine deaminase
VVARATKEAGMRGVLGETVIGFPAPDFKTPQETLAYTEKFIQHWKGDPLITPAVAPHAIYTNSTETLRASRELADRYGVPLIIHVSETKKENDDIERQYKRSPTRFLYENGGFAHRTLFAHGIWISPEDRALMIKHGVAIAHCPSSNLKLASGILPAADALKQGVTVGLGTDGPAGSNNDFNMFEEMDLAAKIAKVSTLDPRVLPAETVFAMATIQGARALHMEKEIGSLEPGKRADLITVSMDEPNGVPRHDPYSMLVYTLKGADVRDVVVEGRVLVRDRQALTLNRAETFRRAEELRRRVDASLKVTRP